MNYEYDSQGRLRASDAITYQYKTNIINITSDRWVAGRVAHGTVAIDRS